MLQDPRECSHASETSGCPGLIANVPSWIDRLEVTCQPPGLMQHVVGGCGHRWRQGS